VNCSVRFVRSRNSEAIRPYRNVHNSVGRSVRSRQNVNNLLKNRRRRIRGYCGREIGSRMYEPVQKICM